MYDVEILQKKYIMPPWYIWTVPNMKNVSPGISDIIEWFDFIIGPGSGKEKLLD